MVRRPTKLLVLVAALCAWAIVAVSAGAAPVQSPESVAADLETSPVLHAKDAADDPAIWVHPTVPGNSLVIGNDKLGALEVYNLDGTTRQRLTSTTKFWGNVDVRQQVVIGGRTTDVVTTLNGGLRVYTVDPTSRMLVPITDNGGVLPSGGGEGLCLYNSAATADVSAFVVNRTGRVRQYQLIDADADGLIEASLVREFFVGSEAEGCVADDTTGALYIAQEDVALWRYSAEPKAGSARVEIDNISANGHLVSDIEGLTLVLIGAQGYLIASAQNVSAPLQSYFAVYDRNTNAYVKSFRITGGAVADGCERTDGIAAYAGSLGDLFPEGVFICQDNYNGAPGAGNQDFKLTQLQKILDLTVASP